jgi:mRNA interferase RelE/StbE
MKFTILYHPLVVHEDIPKLSIEWKTKIQQTIENRLTTYPEIYGKPLRRSLKGYRKLRVSDFRVIFLLEKNLVKILAIQHRSVIYEKINKRT